MCSGKSTQAQELKSAKSKKVWLISIMNSHVIEGALKGSGKSTQAQELKSA